MIVNESTDARTGDRYVETIDIATGTYRLDINGETWEQRALTDAERAAYTPAPDPIAALVERAQKATTVAALRGVLIDTLAQMGS